MRHRSAAATFLGAEGGGPSWSFALGRELHGAFGGVFGGGIAAATLVTAAGLAPDRRPISLHTTFARTLSTPTQVATAEIVAEGRTVTTVAVRLLDADGALAAHATATFASDAALYSFDAAPMRCPELSAFDGGWELPLPKGVEAPLMHSLPLRITGMPRGGFAHAIRAPWPEPGSSLVDTPAAAAMIGDYCAGLAVGAAVGPEGTRIPVPNPDLSLRFVGEAWGELLVGVGRLAKIDRGGAATNVEVWTGPDDAWVAGDERVTLLAVGVSSAVMLAR